MKQNYEENYIRVRINKADFQEYADESDENNLIKKWIELGKKDHFYQEKNSELNKRLDIIEDKLDRFIKMMGYFSHHTYIQSALTPIQKDLSKEEYQNAWYDKNMLSWKVRDSFFPDFKLRSRESDLDEWLAEQAKDDL